MADGKASKKKNFYSLKMVTPTQQAIEMDKDQIKVINGRQGAGSTKKRNTKHKKLAGQKVKRL